MANEKLPCPVCNEAYPKGMNLSNHTRKRHGVNPDGTPFEKSEVPARQASVAVAERPEPGSIVGTGLQAEKVDWTMSDIRARFPSVTFVPPETIPVGWQGQWVQFVEGEEWTGPKIFVDIYTESRRELRNQNPWRQPGDQTGVNVRSGAGAIAETNVAA